MEVRGTDLPEGMRRMSTEWGLILLPGDLPIVDTGSARTKRRVAGGLLLVLAGIVLGIPLEGASSFWPRLIVAGTAAGLGAFLLWPRQPEICVEIEVDVRAGEVRVVERRNDVRTVVSRQPIGPVKAIEIGRTIVPLPKHTDAKAPDTADQMAGSTSGFH